MPPSRTIRFALFSFTLTSPLRFVYAASIDVAAVSGEFEPAKRAAVKLRCGIPREWLFRFQRRCVLLGVIYRTVTDLRRMRVLPAVACVVRHAVQDEKMKFCRLDAAARELDHVAVADPGRKLARVLGTGAK